MALVLRAYGQLLFRPLAGYDVTTYSLPNRVQVTRAMRSLHLPQWDPFRFAGAPLLANPQAAALYPPHWLLLWMAPDRFQSAALVLHVLVAALGAYAFASRALRASPLASAMAAGAFALSGFLHGHLGHFEQTTSLAWLPWALFAADRAVHAPSARAAARAMAGLGAALALVGLAGHTQYLHMAIAAVALYALVTARPLVAAWRAVAGIGLGLALAAAQLLPTVLLSGHSTRSGGFDFASASGYSLPLRQGLSAFLMPYRSQPPVAVEFWAWLPWAVLALALLGLVLRPVDRRVAALVLLAAAGAALAFGSGTPAFRLAYDVVPGVRFFRAPVRWLLLPVTAISLLAAPGLDALGRATRPHRWRALAAAVVVLACVLGLGTQRARPSDLSLVLGAAAGLSVVAAWVVARRWPAAARGAVVAVVAVELLAANSHAYVRRFHMAPGSFLARSATARALDDPTGGRVLSVGGEGMEDFAAMRRDLRPNAQVFDRLRSPDGYDGGLLYTPEWRAAMARLVGKELAPLDTARGSMGRPFDPALFAELDVTRVLVHSVGVPAQAMVPPGSSLLTRVGEIEVWRTPSLGPVFLAGSGPSPELRLHRDFDRPERLVVDVPAAAAGRTVVVSESFAPGWRASGGVTLRRHDDLLMAFTAPRGGGRVVLRYHTPGLVLGAAVTAAALAAAAVLCVWGDGRRRDAPSTLAG
ncbi:MAG: hypothetical protein LC792_00100 [Actinobacteria bacterium]|nr:hypothetical protein [Actinomycetota bacterium]